MQSLLPFPLFQPKGIFLVMVLLMALNACDDTEVVDRTNRSAPQGDSALARASAWADSVVNSLDDAALLRQLILLPAPTPIDSASVQAFIDKMQTGYGGAMLPQADIHSLGAFKALHDSTGLPIWIAADLDTSWLSMHGLPSLVQLGSAASDTLAHAWGGTLGEALSNAGANMAFLSAGRLLRSAMAGVDALGSDPQRVHRQSQGIIRSLKSKGIQPVLRSLPLAASQFPGGPGIYRKNAHALATQDLLPFRALAKADTVFAQSTFLLAEKIDSALAPYSSRIVPMLRVQQDHLVFSPTLRGRDSIASAEAALKCLLSGHDMVVLAGHGIAVEQQLQAWMEDGRLSKDSVRAKAIRVLTQKALLRKTFRPYKGSIPPKEAMVALGQMVTEASITVLRDNRRILPLKGGLANVGIVLLSAAPGKAFSEGLSVYAPVQFASLDTTAAGRPALQALNKEHELLIMPIFMGSKALDPDGRIRPGILRGLRSLDSLGKLLLVNFGPANQIEGLEGFSAIVQAWDARPASQTATAQLILGANAANGRIPIQCGPLFCIGDGVIRGGRNRLAYAIPEAVGADPMLLSRIDQIVEAAIKLGAFPGCQVLAAKGGQVFYHKAFGHHDYSRKRPTELGDLYDIASVTKIAATTLMAMRAYEADTLHFNLPLKHYLPELDSSFITIKDITPQELMIHKAGLPPGLPIYNYCVINDRKDTVRQRLYADSPDSSHKVPITPSLYFNSAYLDSLWLRVRCTPLDTVPQYVYSDMSMFLMQRLLERIMGATLNGYMEREFYKPMGLKTMGYLPAERFDLDRIAPTENDRWWRNQLVHGAVHDPSAAMFGGVGGQAGLFSNSWDLAAIFFMLMNDGAYAGQRFLQPQTIQFFTNRQPESHRGLGFDMQRVNPIPGEGMIAHSAHPSTFGHLGFTGTCAWADPVNDVIFVFLSNRVHPSSDNKKINEMRVRQAVQQAVYEALRLVPKVDEQDCYVE